MKQTEIICGQLNCSVKLADVLTRCSSHPLALRMTRASSRISIYFMQIATEDDVTSDQTWYVCWVGIPIFVKVSKSPLNNNIINCGFKLCHSYHPVLNWAWCYNVIQTIIMWLINALELAGFLLSLSPFHKKLGGTKEYYSRRYHQLDDSNDHPFLNYT